MSWWPAVFTASTYALSTSVWKYHTHFEVFALNNLFVSALLFLTVKYLVDQDRCAEPAEHSVETCIAPPMPGHPRPSNSEISPVPTAPDAHPCLWPLRPMATIVHISECMVVEERGGAGRGR